MLSQIKARQTQLLWGLIGLLSLIILSLTFFLVNISKSQSPKAQKPINTGASRIKPQEAWVHKFTIDADLTRKRLEALEGTLDKLLKLNTSKPEHLSTASQNDFTELRHTLKEDLQGTPLNAKQLPPPPSGSQEIQSCSPSQDKLSQNFPFRSNALQKISLHLYQSRNLSPLKTTDNTIPAGAFAKVVLLGGVDASTSIQSSSDPRPVLLRLISPGTLPRKFQSDLEDCHALAACYGDLSSERVFMRLEKLSCVERKTGEVLEMNVQGYVAGEDGRAGLRGRLVDRSGESLRNAMVGGFLGSVGSFLGKSQQPTLFSPQTGLAQTHPLTTEAMLKQSTASGVGGALDKYADFYIKRAEQLQPVIQVAAGRRADIVFTHGTEFLDSAFRKAVSQKNDKQRFKESHAEESN